MSRRAVAILLAGLAALAAACDPAPPAVRADPAAVMLRFAQALVAGEFEAAHALLAPPLAETLPPEALRERYEAMLAYAEEPARETQVMNVLTDWPGRLPGDAGWAYAAISGLGFSEAVSGVVTEQGRIRELEWGRP